MAKFKRPTLSPRQKFERRYKTGRIDLLVIVILSAINLVLVPTLDAYFLFSAFLPTFLVTLGKLLCGKLPEEYYEGGKESYEFFDTSFLVVMIVLAVIIVGLYLLAWIMSKKHGIGWLIFALVFFSVDTVAMFVLGDLSSLFIDIAFHAAGIVGLAQAIHAQIRLKEMGDEIPVPTTPDTDPNGGVAAFASEDAFVRATAPTPDSTPIREADLGVKARILLEADVLGHKVCYRRVKKVNELIVDQYVYDEKKMTLEFRHTLAATVDGHAIEVGFDGSYSYIALDGQTVKQKLRLV
ncbi:MAG: hypothetical protein IJW29_08255 [Clostridia bacterium]|nr:hypothetical protein [Clostridia bacterium]